ncbi:hypothetical protein [Nocardia arthritidis]|uniref:Uncharacterized protein n=1 Tax=Nocardia arthritidis TaxID=228602 RepID=A0A6G9YMD6_9NOCA|nr:hypothetical protein [Nocardia arthritidis]QIS14368.1 hypothetical protein F5544_32655 [Nocardia arthritidis]
MAHSINEIGQLLVSDLATAYGIANAPDKAMAFFQGVPVDDKIVQSGRINPLRLGQWLALFDTTPILTPATAAITPPPGGESATSWYSAIITGAQPLNATNLAGQQFSTRLNHDKSLFGQVSVDEPLTCEPPDWPMPGTPYWQTWNSASHTTTTTAPGKNLVAGSDWAIRTTEPAATGGGGGSSGGSGEMLMSVAGGPPIIWNPGPGHNFVNDDGLLHDVGQPTTGTTTDTTTTTTSDITIQFDYMLVSLTRQVAGTTWWDDVLLNDPAWYLPGYQAGKLLGRGSGGAVPVLPYALVLARNAVVTGTWDNQQNTTRVGPLRVSVTTSGDSVAVGWAGMQAIALLADVLPDLPPEDDPAS